MTGADRRGLNDLLGAVLDGSWVLGTATDAELAALVDAIPLAVWSYSADGTREAISDRWTQITGQSLDAWHHERWLEVVHPDDRARVAAAWARFVAAGDRTWVERYRVRRADTGEERVVADRVVRIGEGVSAAYVGLSEDVTALVAARVAHRPARSKFRIVPDWLWPAR